MLLPNPPDNVIQKIQIACFEFVWDKKPDKIKRTLSIHDIENGGIGIPNIRAYIQALKLSWLKKLLTSDTKWKKILQHLDPDIPYVHNFGPKKFIQNSTLHSFWIDVFKAYNTLSLNVKLENQREINSEPLFFNDRCHIRGAYFCYGPWIRKGIYVVQDLLKDNESFLTFREFSQKYELNVNFLNYLSCVQSVKKYMSYNDISSENKDKNNKPKSLELICSVKKGSKVYYNRIIEQNEIYDIPAFMKWERKLELYVDWEKVLKKVRKIKEIKFRWFQLKICHGILVTNCILKRMKIVDNEKCNFCNEATDTIQHYLWYCHHSQIFWMDLERMLRSYCSNCERL